MEKIRLNTVRIPNDNNDTVADPGGPGSRPLNFSTKMRPDGPKKRFLVDRPPPPPYLKVWVRHCDKYKTFNQLMS